jgi:hypothetical protein
MYVITNWSEWNKQLLQKAAQPQAMAVVSSALHFFLEL